MTASPASGANISLLENTHVFHQMYSWTSHFTKIVLNDVIFGLSCKWYEVFFMRSIGTIFLWNWNNRKIVTLTFGSEPPELIKDV